MIAKRGGNNARTQLKTYAKLICGLDTRLLLKARVGFLVSFFIDYLPLVWTRDVYHSNRIIIWANTYGWRYYALKPIALFAQTLANFAWPEVRIKGGKN